MSWEAPHDDKPSMMGGMPAAFAAFHASVADDDSTTSEDTADRRFVEGKCPICLRFAKTYPLTCGHDYCRTCLLGAAASYTRSCPLCLCQQQWHRAAQHAPRRGHRRDRGYLRFKRKMEHHVKMSGAMHGHYDGGWSPALRRWRDPGSQDGIWERAVPPPHAGGGGSFGRTKVDVSVSSAEGERLLDPGEVVESVTLERPPSPTPKIEPARRAVESTVQTTVETTVEAVAAPTDAEEPSSEEPGAPSRSLISMENLMDGRPPDQPGDADADSVMAAVIADSDSISSAGSAAIASADAATSKPSGKRPFGSIRCSKCNKFGLTGECCGFKYHIIIRTNRVPKEMRARLLKIGFESYAMADKARGAMAAKYPKRKRKRCNCDSPDHYHNKVAKRGRMGKRTSRATRGARGGGRSARGRGRARGARSASPGATDVLAQRAMLSWRGGGGGGSFSPAGAPLPTALAARGPAWRDDVAFERDPPFVDAWPGPDARFSALQQSFPPVPYVGGGRDSPPHGEPELLPAPPMPGVKTRSAQGSVVPPLVPQSFQGGPESAAVKPEEWMDMLDGIL